MTELVFKHDGSVQCADRGGQTLEEAKAELALIVGEKNILEGFQKTLFVIAMCGAPTGRVNVFRLSPEGLNIFEHGFIGHPGWNFWLFGEEDQHEFAARGGPEVPFPLRINLPDLMCRDCGFPMEAAPVEALEAWRRKAGARILDAIRQSPTPPSTVDGLKGYVLRVIRPGDAWTLDLRRDRVNITVDENDRITGVSFH